MRSDYELGLLADLGWNTGEHQACGGRLHARRPTHPDAVARFIPAWGSFPTRILWCRDYSDELIAALDDHTHRGRYQQNRLIAAMHFAARSGIDSFCYAVYWAAAILNPIQFPTDENSLRGIHPNNTLVKRFKDAFGHTDPLTIALQALINDPTFKLVADARNPTTHRYDPSRIISVSVGGSDPTIPEFQASFPDEATFDLDEAEICRRRQWLESSLGSLQSAFDQFSSARL